MPAGGEARHELGEAVVGTWRWDVAHVHLFYGGLVDLLVVGYGDVGGRSEVLGAVPGLLLVEPVLRLDPGLERPQEGRYHVEAAVLDRVLRGRLRVLRAVLSPAQHGQVGQLVPADARYLLARLRLKGIVLGHAAEDVQHHALLAHRHADALHLRLRQHQVRGAQVVPRLLPNLAHGAVQVGLLLVDLAAGEAPLGALLPALDQHGLGHILVEHDGAADGHADLVGEELVVGLGVQLRRVGREQRAVLEDEVRELAQVHRREAGGVQRADKVFVEPLGLLDLEADALHRQQLLAGQVDDEAHAQVVEPVNERHLGVGHGGGLSGPCRACRGRVCFLDGELSSRGGGRDRRRIALGVLGSECGRGIPV